MKISNATEQKKTTQFRLVAFIFPETDWTGEKIDESARIVIASKHDVGNENMRFDICEVEYDQMADAMRLGSLARQFHFPDNGDNLTTWGKIYRKLKNACARTPLYKEDFAEISEFYLPENESQDD